MTTAFLTDERCFWHGGGSYSLTLPAGGFVQPGGGLPENPETKRRLKNLLDVSGLLRELDVNSAPEASRDDLLRVHPASYLDAFKAASDAGGGELGLRTPFGKGGYEVAALSAGLAVAAVNTVLTGAATNAYALSRPPGHHCLPDWPNGFCLLANIAIAIRAAQEKGLARRIAVVDWDVHHGNGTEAIFLSDPSVLTLSVHQEWNYPLDTGAATVRGEGKGHGFNMNIPLPPGAGHESYLEVMDRIVLPALDRFRPEAIVVACGYDAAALDPLGRMLATAETFRLMTRKMMQVAEDLCDGKLILVHEGGYSETYVPFCGHAVIEEMSGTAIRVPDPLAETVAARQPGPQWQAHLSAHIAELAGFFGL
ncbi:acetoin utilization deacetylase AcuC-like enzyme [Defluviimonas denitrificans]|jgi:acetoin utilization deacetylase AcuC-like enzyme|uniref:Acetoin utilization deacetylase AcuC-like enzyme n=1 Tax=Albidovulum denitrificans TaxID=404881 RepID=A0A2S8S6P4_9RHOB|nr:class II histone deacetylase [Defluviimonas denitrificans]PQV56443.1 acetoin utilization deacetylase AcuC-like enzyme [Defluviimonas denitrificans]